MVRASAERLETRREASRRAGSRPPRPSVSPRLRRRAWSQPQSRVPELRAAETDLAAACRAISCGSRPVSTLATRSTSSTVARQETDGVAAFGGEFHAAAADDVVGRLVADDAAERRGPQAPSRRSACRRRPCTMWSATAAAEPLDEPPGVCAGLCGLRVTLGQSPANSQVIVLPRITAPAARTSATEDASVVVRLLR